MYQFILDSDKQKRKLHVEGHLKITNKLIFIVFIGIICLHTGKNLNSLSYGQVNKKFYREVLCIIWNSFFQYFTTRIFYFIDLFYFFTDPTPSWRESIRRQMEEELEQRVREALETPPLERAKRAEVNSKERKSCQTLNELNSHIVFGLTGTNRDVLKSRKWRALQAKRQVQRLMRMNYIQPTPPVDYVFQEGLSRSNQADFPGVFGLTSLSEGVKDLRQSFEKYPSLTQIQRQFYTKHGFLATINSGHGNNLKRENGKYKDRYGVERDQDGPFWPSDCGPLFPTPRFQWFDNIPPEPLFFHVHSK